MDVVPKITKFRRKEMTKRVAAVSELLILLTQRLCSCLAVCTRVFVSAFVPLLVFCKCVPVLG